MNHYLDALNVTAAHTFEDVNAQLLRLGLTDGLPVVPPTAERIATMLGGRDPAAAVARLAPGNGEATLRRLAICAVLAGCRPEVFPVLIAATRAVADPAFNRLGVQTTTGNVAVMLLLNGPIVTRCGFNAGHNALGPGNRANATVGRALNLILRNVGEAIPGRTDMATMGQPAKYTCCCAEHEAASPWEPLHVSRGLAAQDSAVTVLPTPGIMEVVDSVSSDAEGLLTTFAGSMTIAGTIGGEGLLGGGQPLLLLAPEHAERIARTHSRAQAQVALHARARLPLAALAPELAAHLRQTVGGAAWADGSLPVARDPADVLFAVVGGVGIKSAYVPSWGGGGRAITRRIED